MCRYGSCWAQIQSNKTFFFFVTEKGTKQAKGTLLGWSNIYGYSSSTYSIVFEAKARSWELEWSCIMCSILLGSNLAWKYLTRAKYLTLTTASTFYTVIDITAVKHFNSMLPSVNCILSSSLTLYKNQLEWLWHTYNQPGKLAWDKHSNSCLFCNARVQL
jgi:hypothetical protein